MTQKIGFPVRAHPSDHVQDIIIVTNGAKLGLPQLRWTKIDETF